MRFLNQTIQLGLITFMVVGCQTNKKVHIVSQGEGKSKTLLVSDDPKSSLRSIETDRTLQTTALNLEDRIKENPKDTKSLIELSKIRFAQTRYGEAFRLAQQALRWNIHDQDAKEILASIAVREKRLDLAENLIGSLDPKNKLTIHKLSGMVALARNKNERAMQEFKAALEIDPSDISTRMNLGMMFFEYRQLKPAAIHFERVLQVAPHHADAKAQLAAIYANQGSLEVAEGYYKDVLRQQSDHPLTLFNYAVLKKKQGDYPRAIALTKEYLQTPYASRSNSEFAFQLLEGIRKAEDAEGKSSISDQDILRLAQEAEMKSDPVKEAGDGDRGFGPSDASSDKEIEELEKMLAH